MITSLSQILLQNLKQKLNKETVQIVLLINSPNIWQMSPGEVTARGNRDVGKVGSLGKGPWGKRHAWEVSHGENSTGKTGLGKMSPRK